MKLRSVGAFPVATDSGQCRGTHTLQQADIMMYGDTEAALRWPRLGCPLLLVTDRPRQTPTRPGTRTLSTLYLLCQPPRMKRSIRSWLSSFLLHCERSSDDPVAITNGPQLPQLPLPLSTVSPSPPHSPPLNPYSTSCSSADRTPPQKPQPRPSQWSLRREQRRRQTAPATSRSPSSSRPRSSSGRSGGTWGVG